MYVYTLLVQHYRTLSLNLPNIKHLAGGPNLDVAPFWSIGYGAPDMGYKNIG